MPRSSSTTISEYAADFSVRLIMGGCAVSVMVRDALRDISSAVLMHMLCTSFGSTAPAAIFIFALGRRNFAAARPQLQELSVN